MMSLTLICLNLMLTCVVGKNLVFEVQNKQKLYEKTIREMVQRPDRLDVPLADSGHGVNCDPKANKVDFSWTPKILHKSTQNLTLTINILPTTVDFIGGQIYLNVTYKDNPNILLWEFTKNGGCADLKKLGFEGLTCPVKTHDNVMMTLKETAADLANLPQGDFVVTIVITNERGQVFLCEKAEIDMEP